MAVLFPRDFVGALAPCLLALVPSGLIVPSGGLLGLVAPWVWAVLVPSGLLGPPSLVRCLALVRAHCLHPGRLRAEVGVEDPTATGLSRV